MVQLSRISVSFGGQSVLDDLTWTIKPGKRYGLVGPNGAGKTTLLRVVYGTQDLDGGTVSIAGQSIGYLQQDFQEDHEDRSVLDEAMLAFAETIELQQREASITEQLGHGSDYDESEYQRLVHELESVHHELASREAHLIRPRTEAVLMGLGFTVDDFQRPLSSFSGGWRMRVALARLLLVRPDVLLLDEPTNHLDIDSIAWLEGYLKSYPGTVVIVSHDRYFLDRMITSIAELYQGKINEYAGNYTFYLEQRTERRQLQQSAYDNQQREIAQAERFIERFRAKATKARQVQSRIKALERMERVAPPPSEDAAITIRFPSPRRSGKVVLEFSRFSKSYPTDEETIEVFQDAGPLTIERGDKVALIGKNGAGKSTLARMINGSEPFDGSRTLGHEVELTFFAQHQAESLSPSKTVLDTLLEAARGQTETEVRNLLGAFLFSGDDVLKKVAVLSGGERSRVALAKALLVPANFLVLDEPTNHLDMQSVNVLIEALRQYSGTFIVVSHDRHFLDQVATVVWRVGNGAVRRYVGNYSDYLWQSEHGTAAQLERVQQPTAQTRHDETEKTTPTVPQKKSGKKSKEQKRREAEERRRISGRPIGETAKDLDALSEYQLRKLYSKVEQRILQTERRQRKIEKSFNDAKMYEDLDLARATNQEYESIKGELDELYETWEAVAVRLDGKDE